MNNFTDNYNYFTSGSTNYSKTLPDEYFNSLILDIDEEYRPFSFTDKAMDTLRYIVLNMLFCFTYAILHSTSEDNLVHTKIITDLYQQLKFPLIYTVGRREYAETNEQKTNFGEIIKDIQEHIGLQTQAFTSEAQTYLTMVAEDYILQIIYSASIISRHENRHIVDSGDIFRGIKIQEVNLHNPSTYNSIDI